MIFKLHIKKGNKYIRKVYAIIDGKGKYYDYDSRIETYKEAYTRITGKVEVVAYNHWGKYHYSYWTEPSNQSTILNKSKGILRW